MNYIDYGLLILNKKVLKNNKKAFFQFLHYLKNYH